MIELITEQQTNQVAEMEAFIRSHPKGHFLQSPTWRQVKPQWRWRGILVRDGGQITGALSLLIRPLALGISLLYAPRGPVCAPDDRETLERLFAGAEQIARETGGCALLLDPDIPASDHVFQDRMDTLGFQCQQISGFDGIQPQFVFRLEIGGKSEEEVFAGFASKTRYQVRLARRRGVTVSHWAGDQGIPEEALKRFSTLMEETGQRDHFLVRSEAYFRRLLTTLGGCARLYLAQLGGEAIAGTIAIQYGDKTWYLYGASSNRHRDAMPNYLLQWEMIRWAIAGGCRVYDFRGVSGDIRPDSPLYGLYRFKKGFGGDFTAFCGQYTKVYRPLSYRLLELGLWANRQWRALLRGRREA